MGNRTRRGSEVEGDEESSPAKGFSTKGVPTFKALFYDDLGIDKYSDLERMDDGRKKALFEIGKKLFREQIKFSVLQMLILLELALTSDSRTIWGLCGGGVFILLFVPAVVRGGHEESLVRLYPLTLMVSTSLLSLIILLKVLFIREQTDLSPVFLGVALTSDHALLATNLIPMITRYSFAKYKKEWVKNEEEGCAAICTGMTSLPSMTSLPRKMPCRRGCKFFSLRAIPDLLAFVILSVYFVAGYLIYYIHMAISYILMHFAFWFRLDDRFEKWKDKVRLDRDEDELMIKQIKKVTMDNVRYYITVLIVDLEFTAIAIAMAVTSGGATVGGTQMGA